MPHAGPQLTPRLIEVADLVVAGATDAQIGRILGLSPGGVRTHIRRLLVMTGAQNRTQAATQAIDAGILDTPGGRAFVAVEHLQVLLAALRTAEGKCHAVAGLADRFEAAYPAVSATPSGCGANLVRKSRQFSASKEPAL
jgi:DNA-binding CsgD family transcriptional regulator